MAKASDVAMSDHGASAIMPHGGSYHYRRQHGVSTLHLTIGSLHALVPCGAGSSRIPLWLNDVRISPDWYLSVLKTLLSS